ncbi:carbon-nitrogen hydrolase family protein [Xanthomonas graminis]|jgi:predicted amidohydrolase|uniref:Nitrile hydratase n=1 Tax=Xanthomonas graminis pv. graminis TaxID=134874 RepID=A0A1M4L2W7_9XANT|nr:carbon-nitrogen hydrolase family protein [Xanthomonas translucens]EKU25436.1 Carbon-nitrogen hydrolase family protein [Xanthomonas translucens pv. graminis ART-Xtg29]OAX61464.1 nitrilase [Xanthomonas translucens pv. graminis]UKE53236.1 carbon-nitrogen hydrolase family protein [Xanthomonas translucens pv. graminis]WIH07558.1 carbon-nitrogen hydrolase family protein [Xanthomonas translucens pv. graminis]WIH10983.1 carbon-nitrogen hydrolase family protein [Xanthomonas translucens pv. graminis]
MKIAVAKYPIGAPVDFAAFADKQAALIGQAAQAGAQLAVLPEYLSLELAATFAAAVAEDLPASLAAIQALHPQYLALFAQLAQRHRLHLLAGSFLLASGEGRYRNRAYWFAPDGRHGWQDKLQLTGFEKATGLIDRGDALKVFAAGDGVRAGVAVCYDSEFPLPVRAQYEAGARLLVVPSCTDTEAGATRVRIGCLARALENRIFVAQSVTAGLAEWSPALDVNTGEAAIYAPMDAGFPADGIVAQTRGEQVWALAELDFAAFEASRTRAQVANDRDWRGQLAPAIVRAELAGFD